jgi:hypothetical protein
VAVMMQAEIVAPRTNGLQPSATAMPQAGAAQMGPLPEQIEIAVPMMETTQLDATTPL